MNNKGFTLIEVLLTISIISIITIVFIANVGDTFGLSSEKSYEILKKSIVTQASEYIYECDNGLFDCVGDYEWVEVGDVKKTSFYLDVMKKYSYFSEDDYINPITNKDIGSCLIIKAEKDEGFTLDVKLDDAKCEK